MKTKQTKTFRQQVLSMTAGEIIMAMVKGLEKPVTEINMTTFGESSGNICYGCAATNAVCKISKIKFKPETIFPAYKRADAVKSTKNFLQIFECAIDNLRRGDISGYNKTAARGKFRRIQNPKKIYLTYLYGDYSQQDLISYKQLAKHQRP